MICASTGAEVRQMAPLVGLRASPNYRTSWMLIRWKALRSRFVDFRTTIASTPCLGIAEPNRRFFAIQTMFRAGAARRARFLPRPWRRKSVGAQSPALHPFPCDHAQARRQSRRHFRLLSYMPRRRHGIWRVGQTALRRSEDETTRNQIKETAPAPGEAEAAIPHRDASAVNRPVD